MTNLVTFENTKTKVSAKKEKTNFRQIKVLLEDNHVATISYKSENKWNRVYELVPVPGTEKWKCEPTGKYGNDINLFCEGDKLQDVKTEVSKKINTHIESIKSIDANAKMQAE